MLDTLLSMERLNNHELQLLFFFFFSVKTMTLRQQNFFSPFLSFVLIGETTVSNLSFLSVRNWEKKQQKTTRLLQMLFKEDIQYKKLVQKAFAVISRDLGLRSGNCKTSVVEWKRILVLSCVAFSLLRHVRGTFLLLLSVPAMLFYATVIRWNTHASVGPCHLSTAYYQQ